MPEKVVVAVDGGVAGDAAVRWVGARAVDHDLEVHVTTVIPSDAADAGDDQHAKALAEASGALRGTRAARLLVEHTRYGEPFEELLAAGREADLLVVGTNRTSGLASLLHLTLPLKLAAAATRPLVVVPAGWEQRSGPVLVGWADDGSSDDAIEFAAEEAERSGSELVVVHAWEPPPTNVFDDEGTRERTEKALHATRDAVDREVRRVRSGRPELEVRTTLSSDPADDVLTSMAPGARLAVIGSHGRGAVADLLVGSVGDDLIRDMTCPVVIVPRRDSEPIPVYRTALVDEV